MLKAVIFDFDGTIIDTETVWFRVFKEILEEKYNLQLPIEEFARVIGTTDEVLYEYIEAQLGMEIDRDEMRERVNRRFLDLKGVLKVREGVLDKIKEAQSLGYKIALASSSSREWIDGFLEQFSLRGYFPVIKTKEDVEKVKPDPSLYLKAMEELGVEPHEALAIEDSANGALAAIAAGMNCTVIPNEVTSFLKFHEKAVRSETFADLKFK